MNDPFDLLREQLETAARPRPGAHSRGRGGLVLVAMAGALSALAVAAAVMAPEPGPPRTAGPAPAPSVSPAAPDFELRPDMTAGTIGWCASMPGGSACGSAASPERATIVAGATVSRSAGTYFAVVSERVGTVVLPDGRRLVPRRDPRAPAPWKVVIGTFTGPFGEVRFLDATGREVPSEDPRGSWAAGRGRYPTRRSDPDGPCRMRVPAPFRVRSTSVMSSLPAGRDDVARPSFLSCATTVVYDGKVRLRAAILLNAHAPSDTAPLLPGMASEPAGIVDTGRLTSARRAGDGWLMVYGADAKLRARLLRAIREQAP